MAVRLAGLWRVLVVVYALFASGIVALVAVRLSERKGAEYVAAWSSFPLCVDDAGTPRAANLGSPLPAGVIPDTYAQAMPEGAIPAGGQSAIPPGYLPAGQGSPGNVHTLVSPAGELIGMPAEHVQAALQQGYRRCRLPGERGQIEPLSETLGFAVLALAAGFAVLFGGGLVVRWIYRGLVTQAPPSQTRPYAHCAHAVRLLSAPRG
jgi:hypothetical protein